MGGSISQLKELPWVDIAHVVAEHVCTWNRMFFASCSMNVPQLSKYIRRWRASNKLVDTVMGWKGHYQPKVICEASGPGAWLAGFI